MPDLPIDYKRDPANLQATNAKFAVACVNRVRALIDTQERTAPSATRQAAAEHAAIRELGNRVEASAWRDIATAPKDGTPILACEAGTAWQGRAEWAGGEWRVDVCGKGGFYYACTSLAHWVPLPAKPKGSADAH